VKLLESFEYTIKEFGSTSKILHAIVLEYCELGTLQQYLKRVRGDIKSSKNIMNRFSFLPEEEVRFALRQLLRALSMIHAHAIVHRDIKPENILLTASSSNPFVDRQNFTLLDCVLKLSDFGLAVKMKNDDDWNSGQKCPCGTPVTMAPEVILAGKQKRTQTRPGIVEEYHSVVGYGQPADLWSTGVIQYLMLVGHFPFISSKPPSLKSSSLETSNSRKFHHIKTAMQEVVKGTLIIPSNILISTSGNDLLHQLLNKNPTQRGFARGKRKNVLIFHFRFDSLK
jgi:serine/threonine protein kinase